MLAAAIPRSRRLTALQPTAVNAILAEARELLSQGKTLSSLVRGEPHLPTPPQIGRAVILGAAYGPGGEGTLRISFASGGDTLTRGLDRLRDGLTRIAESAA